MSKRRSLVESLAATQEATARDDAPEGQPAVVVSVNLPKRTLKLLYDLAGARRYDRGSGRASVSAELAALVEKHRAELEAELAELAARI